MLARGFVRPAFVGYQTGDRWDSDRVSGFRAALARHGVPAEAADVLLVDDASAARKIRSLLTGARRGAAGPAGRPGAIVAGSDRLAAVVYAVATELRLRIGRDLGVTGFDGSTAATLLHPRLTSAVIPVEEIAGRVIDRVLRQLDLGPDESPGEVVPAVLRLGESTAGPQGPDPGGPVRPGGDQAAPDRKRFQEAPGGPAGRRVTITDVAADAGVGVGTVSRVLNGGDQVRAATRNAVQDSIDRLRYRPSYAAAALVRGTPRTVAVLVAHMTRPSTVVRVASALAVLADEGYDTIICNVDTAAERDRHLETLLPDPPCRRRDGHQPAAVPRAADPVRPGRGDAGQRGRGHPGRAADAHR